MLGKVTTTVTYRVPLGSYCNMTQPGTLTKLTKNTCRFCAKSGKNTYCTLYNEPLSVEGGLLVYKAPACQKAIAKHSSIVEEPAQIAPKEIVKYAVKEYIKTYNSLISQGYPASLAEEAARKALTE